MRRIGVPTPATLAIIILTIDPNSTIIPCACRHVLEIEFIRINYFLYWVYSYSVLQISANPPINRDNTIICKKQCETYEIHQIVNKKLTINIGYICPLLQAQNKVFCLSF